MCWWDLNLEDTVSETLQKERIRIPGSRLHHSAAVHTFSLCESSLYAAACAYLTVIYTKCTEKSQDCSICGVEDKLEFSLCLYFQTSVTLE